MTDQKYIYLTVCPYFFRVIVTFLHIINKNTPKFLGSPIQMYFFEKNEYHFNFSLSFDRKVSFV